MISNEPVHRRRETGHWQVGSNIPGYLPETDPECFETFHDAAQYLSGELNTFQDYCVDACSGTALCQPCADFATALDIRVELKTMTSPDYPEQPYRDLVFYTSRLAWWITKVPAEKCECDHGSE